jgi:fatty acid desaturase
VITERKYREQLSNDEWCITQRRAAAKTYAQFAWGFGTLTVIALALLVVERIWLALPAAVAYGAFSRDAMKQRAKETDEADRLERGEDIWR